MKNKLTGRDFLRFRQALGVSTKDIGKLIGLNKRTVVAIENERADRPLPPDFEYRLSAVFFGVDPVKEPAELPLGQRLLIAAAAKNLPRWSDIADKELKALGMP